jgi:colanic acid biosynthesis glycosyl transferase WcaI
MRILILGLNYAPEKVGIAVYTSGMAEALVTRDHQVQVISGQPYYPAWAIFDGYSKIWFDRRMENNVDVTRAPHYVPSQPSGAKRLVHHATFALAAFFPTIIRAFTWRPDVILTVAPSLASTPVALLAAKLSGAHSWLHVQDFEVEAAFATGLLTEKSFMGKFAQAFEKFILRSFDRVSTISPQMVRKLVEKNIKTSSLVEFRNWSDIRNVYPLTAASALKDEWNIKTPSVALYSGNIANKQGIEIIVEVARLLSSRTDLTFVICGEGPNRSTLEQRAIGLGNIQFHNLQPVNRLNDVVNLATVHLLPQLGGAADLVLPSKLTNMLASGRPVVASAATGTGIAIELEGCGICTPPDNADEMAKAISYILDNPAQYAAMSTTARKRAEERWAKDGILDAFEAQLQHLVEGGDSK